MANPMNCSVYESRVPKFTAHVFKNDSFFTLDLDNQCHRSEDDEVSSQRQISDQFDVADERQE